MKSLVHLYISFLNKKALKLIHVVFLATFRYFDKLKKDSNREKKVPAKKVSNAMPDRFVHDHAKIVNGNDLKNPFEKNVGGSGPMVTGKNVSS